MIEAQGGVGEPGNAIQVPAAKKQVLKSEDLARLRDIGPPYPEPARHFIALSPDRQRIAFQVREGDPGANGYNLAMFVVALKPSATPVKIDRSEEHTSELQSLMRISYAVFCLKKKKDKRNRLRN